MATTAKIKRRNTAQLAADGFAALVEKLGMAEALRYVQLNRQGSRDCARERHVWLDTMSHDQIGELSCRRRAKRTRGNELGISARSPAVAPR